MDGSHADEAESREAGAGRARALADRLRQGLGAVVSKGGGGVGRLAEAARELGGSALVKQGLAARERGNLEAAFALLREAFEGEPEDLRAAAAFWDAALASQRGPEAVAAASLLVRQHALAEELELAVQYWIELVDAAPEALLPPALLMRVVPELRRRAAEGAPAGEEAAGAARSLLLRALRDAADSRNEGLTAGQALRLFEEAHEDAPEVARRAAQVALASPDLHEAKRERLEQWLAGGAAPAAEARPLPPPPTSAEEGDLKVVEALPKALREDGVEVRFAGERRALLGFDEIEAVSAVSVPGSGGRSRTLVDLIFNWSLHGDEPLRVARLFSDAFDATELMPGTPEPAEALRAFLAELLERSRAVPLPDPDSALGLRLREFRSVVEYERAVLRSG